VTKTKKVNRPLIGADWTPAEWERFWTLLLTPLAELANARERLARVDDEL
jgi:hypothetical protein